jgi:hypothetical protein
MKNCTPPRICSLLAQAQLRPPHLERIIFFQLSIETMRLAESEERNGLAPPELEVAPRAGLKG